MNGLTERVIVELERLLHRKLTPEEVRLILLAGVLALEILESETLPDTGGVQAA
jgi:hypothetical protein